MLIENIYANYAKIYANYANMLIVQIYMLAMLVKLDYLIA